MSLRTTLIVVLVLVIAAAGASLLAAPQLPERVPSHWNAAGQIDGYSSRETSMWLMPGMILGLSLLMLYLPKLDPLRKNIDLFRPSYHWMVIGLAAFLSYIHGLTLLAGLGYAFNMTSMIIPAFALLFAGLGFLVERAKPNWFIGFRTPWTLSSPTVWEKTHKLGGLTMKIGGAGALLGLLLPPESGFLLSMGCVMAGALIPGIYSYWVFRREQQGSK